MDSAEKMGMIVFIGALLFLGIVWILSLTILEPSNDVNLTITHSKVDMNLSNQDYMLACFEGCNEHFRNDGVKLNSCYGQCNVMYLGFKGDLYGE